MGEKIREKKKRMTEEGENRLQLLKWKHLVPMTIGQFKCTIQGIKANGTERI